MRKSLRCQPSDVRLGQRIRHFRQLNKLTQTELGNVLGVTFQQVQKYERGMNCVPATRLAIIAELFGVTPNDLLEFTPVSFERRELEALDIFLSITAKGHLGLWLSIGRMLAEFK